MPRRRINECAKKKRSPAPVSGKKASFVSPVGLEIHMGARDNLLCATKGPKSCQTFFRRRHPAPRYNLCVTDTPSLNPNENPNWLRTNVREKPGGSMNENYSKFVSEVHSKSAHVSKNEQICLRQNVFF